MNKTLKSHSSTDTFNLGVDFGKNLSGGEIVFLSGILGAGKTVFVRGVAKALKVKRKITSPTFNIFRLYDCKFGKTGKRGKLYHFDCYRLRKYSELESLGFEEIIRDKNSVTLLEWPDCIDFLSQNKISNLFFVKITVLKNSDLRKIKLKKQL